MNFFPFPGKTIAAAVFQHGEGEDGTAKSGSQVVLDMSVQTNTSAIFGLRGLPMPPCFMLHRSGEGVHRNVAK
ncbi:hypothetical protein HSX11_25120 [Oxalobacteraceae bacterium]|nr:hypothetical protein [Oxalobacteraceae bacterium]